MSTVGSFVAYNRSVTLILDTHFIPINAYQTSNLNIYYSIDLGGAVSQESVCHISFTHLATLKNHTPCNSTYIPVTPNMMTPSDTCVSFTCTSTGTQTLKPSDFVNMKISGGLCSPTNSSYCPVTFENGQGGVNLASLIYPVSILFNKSPTTVTATTASDPVTVNNDSTNVSISDSYSVITAIPIEFAPGSSTSSFSSVALIAGVLTACIMLIISLVVVLNMKKLTIKNNLDKLEQGSTAGSSSQHELLPILPRSSSNLNHAEIRNVEKQAYERSDMFQSMTRLQREFLRPGVELQQRDVEVVASLNSEPSLQYDTMSQPPAYSESASSELKILFGRSSVP